MNRKYVVLTIGTLLVTILLYLGASEIMGVSLFRKEKVYYQTPESTTRKGQLAPSFSILLPDSSTYIDIGAVPSGKPFVLFYFSPQCPFCRMELKEIVHNSKQLEDIQFFIFTPFPFKEMRDFYREFQIEKVPNVRMGIDYKFFFGAYFQVTSIPFLAIYGKNKRLNDAFGGYVKADQIIDVANR